MVRDELSVLSAFLAVAEERSFTRAAKRLGDRRGADGFSTSIRIGSTPILNRKTRLRSG